MSMNITITAYRDCTVISTGKKFVDSSTFPVWQTPTLVTYAILKSDNPLEEYIKFVKGIAHDEIEYEYSDDDYFSENAIGSHIINTGDEHIAELHEWLANAAADGYTVKYEMI